MSKIINYKLIESDSIDSQGNLFTKNCIENMLISLNEFKNTKSPIITRGIDFANSNSTTVQIKQLNGIIYINEINE